MKYNKGFAPILITLLVLGALIIGGGAYYMGKSKEEDKKIEVNPNIDDTVVDTEQTSNSVEKNGVKTHINLNAGYQVSYPSDWYIKNSDTAMSTSGYNSFVIQNRKNAVRSGSDFSLETDGSYISIGVNSNMNYSNYEEFIKDPKTDLPKSAKEARLAKLKMINIGGKTLQVFGGEWDGKTLPGDSYDFVYNKKLYSLGFGSGSKEQYYKDKKIFEDMVSSFKFLDSEESAISENISTPLFIKSVYKKDGKWWADVDYVTKVSPLEHMTKKINDGLCVIPKMTKSEMLTYAKNTVKNYVEENNLLVVYCGYDRQGIWASDGIPSMFINLNPAIRSSPFAVNFNGFEKFNQICKGNSLQTPEMIKNDIEQQIEEKTINQYSFDTYETKGYFQDSVIIENGEIKKFNGDPSCPN